MRAASGVLPAALRPVMPRRLALLMFSASRPSRSRCSFIEETPLNAAAPKIGCDCPFTQRDVRTVHDRAPADAEVPAARAAPIRQQLP